METKRKEALATIVNGYTEITPEVYDALRSIKQDLRVLEILKKYLNLSLRVCRPMNTVPLPTLYAKPSAVVNNEEYKLLKEWLGK